MKHHDRVKRIKPASTWLEDFAATIAAQPDAGWETDVETRDAANVAAAPTLSHIGRYALKHHIASGGLGTVFEAWDPLLSRTVAVKTLHLETESASQTARDDLILSEARTAASLSHRYIVTVHDAGLSPKGIYIAMERLHGRDLRQALTEGWRPRADHAAQLIRRVADALSYAHGQGVVHCDIKPANIYLTQHNRPKVLDFGIARAAGAGAGAGSHARDSTVMGSPHYLSPEQLRGDEIDPRTDVYSLGVVAYELLTGRKAFDGKRLSDITHAVQSGKVAAVHQVCADVPVALSDIIAKAMARTATGRYSTATAFSLALHKWQRDIAAHAPMFKTAVAKKRPTRRTSGTALVVLCTLLCVVLAMWLGKVIL